MKLTKEQRKERQKIKEDEPPRDITKEDIESLLEHFGGKR